MVELTYVGLGFCSVLSIYCILESYTVYVFRYNAADERLSTESSYEIAETVRLFLCFICSSNIPKQSLCYNQEQYL